MQTGSLHFNWEEEFHLNCATSKNSKRCNSILNVWCLNPAFNRKKINNIWNDVGSLLTFDQIVAPLSGNRIWIDFRPSKICCFYFPAWVFIPHIASFNIHILRWFFRFIASLNRCSKILKSQNRDSTTRRIIFTLAWTVILAIEFCLLIFQLCICETE